MIYALDSNTVSYLLKDNSAVYSHYISALNQGDYCVLPLIVYYEILRGLKAKDAKKQLPMFEDFAKDIDIIDLSVADIMTASEIYAYQKKSGKPMGDSDLLIAAQCVARDYTLVTNNTKHFAHVGGLRLIDWSKPSS